MSLAARAVPPTRARRVHCPADLRKHTLAFKKSGKADPMAYNPEMDGYVVRRGFAVFGFTRFN